MSEATLTPEEISEVMIYIRDNSDCKIVSTKEGFYIAVTKDGKYFGAMHPRTFLELIREVKKEEGDV